MEQKEFFELLDQALEGKSIEEIEAIVRQVKHSWMSLYLEDKLKDYLYCRHCKCYSKKSDCKYQVVHVSSPYYSDGSKYYRDMKKGVYLCPRCGEETDYVSNEWE